RSGRVAAGGGGTFGGGGPRSLWAARGGAVQARGGRSWGAPAPPDGPPPPPRPAGSWAHRARALHFLTATGEEMGGCMVTAAARLTSAAVPCERPALKRSGQSRPSWFSSTTTRRAAILPEVSRRSG